MPSQKYTSKARNFPSGGSRQYQLLSTCLSTGFLALACLQLLLTLASEPKKTSLMQFCCNISPSPVADTVLMTTVIFLLWLRWSMVVSSKLKDPQTHPENLSHVSHPVSCDHKQTCNEVKAVRIKTGYFCSSSQRHFPVKVSKINRYSSVWPYTMFFQIKLLDENISL